MTPPRLTPDEVAELELTPLGYRVVPIIASATMLASLWNTREYATCPAEMQAHWQMALSAAPVPPLAPLATQIATLTAENARLLDVVKMLLALKDRGPAPDDILCHVYQAEADLAWTLARAAVSQSGQERA